MGKSAQAAVAVTSAVADIEELADSPEMEFPDDSAIASLDDKPESEVVVRDEKASGDTMLSRYFHDMAMHRVLRPDEEVEAAKLVEDLERKYWAALFAYPPALETVARVLISSLAPEQTMPPQLEELQKLVPAALNAKVTKKQQERWDTLAWELSCKLRELDGDRLYVEGSYSAVQRLLGRRAVESDLIGGEVQLTPAFKRYVARVESARTEQKRAKNRFVAANLRLVVSIARRYNRGRMPLIDLIQEGNLGLMKAVERFDHTRLSLQHVRVLVDSSRHQPRARRQGPRRAYPRAHARHVQPRAEGHSGHQLAHRQRAHLRRARQRDGHRRGQARKDAGLLGRHAVLARPSGQR